MPAVALSIGADAPALAAALPLLEGGMIEALEWSFDTCWRPAPAVEALLEHYARAGALYGHGVGLSVLSGETTAREQRWMHMAGVEATRRDYRHVTVHEGFMTAGGRQWGAPLPMPFHPEVVVVGVERLKRFREAMDGPIGLENLAIALSPRDVDQQGELLEALLAPVDGILLLDLHNLWCRAVNFDRDPVELMERLPLERVREVHVSGGSWDRGFRRDTHDARTPDEVFELLDAACARCPRLEVVVVERLGSSLGTPDSTKELRADVERVRSVIRKRGDTGVAGVERTGSGSRSWSGVSIGHGTHRVHGGMVEGSPRVDGLQCALLDLLEGGASAPDLHEALRTVDLEDATGWVDTLDTRSVQVAVSLVRKWTRR